MKGNMGIFRALVVGVAALSFPLVADATVLKITDVASGDEEIRTNSGLVDYSGVVGGFVVDVDGAGKGKHALGVNSIQATGTGHLRIIMKKTGMKNFGASSADILGQALFTTTPQKVSVRNFVNFGNGWENIGGAMDFYGRDGNGQSDSVFGSVKDGNGTVLLRTVINIFTGGNNSLSRANPSLDMNTALAASVSPVPVPAAGLLLLGGLGALVAFRRRNSKTAAA